MLAVATMICVALTATASFIVFHASLPPSDGAYGTPWWSFLNDPFVTFALVMYGTIAAALAYPFTLFLLLRTRLRVTIPLTGTMTLLATAVATSLVIYLAAIVIGLYIGILTMGLCWLLFPLTPRRSPSIAQGPGSASAVRLDASPARTFRE